MTKVEKRIVIPSVAQANQSKAKLILSLSKDESHNPNFHRDDTIFRGGSWLYCTSQKIIFIKTSFIFFKDNAIQADV